MTKKQKGKDAITEFIAEEVNEKPSNVSKLHLFSALEQTLENEKLLAALKFVSTSLKKNPVLVKSAIKSDQGKFEAFFTTIDELLEEVGAMLAEERLQYVPNNLKQDPELVKKAGKLDDKQQ
ncbi:MAG: hypothetical protein PHR96_00250 [Clostridia bacterium]|nr:hypothetical protein [Clostridia bacterium]